MPDDDPTSNEPTSAVRTLHVRIEESDSFFDRVGEKIEALDAGEAIEGTSDRGLSLPDDEALARVFTAQNLQLVRAIAQHEPPSMRALAEIVDRDIKNVSRNLNELEQLGLIDFVQEGRAKRPVVPYDAIEVHYPVRGVDSGSGSSGLSPADD